MKLYKASIQRYSLPFNAILFKITVSGLYDLNITYISMRDMHLKTS